MDFTSDYLDNLTTKIDAIDKNQFYIKENLFYFSQSEKIKPIKVKFSNQIVAISPNRGLIAFCVKGGHFIDKDLNNKIIVMFQTSFKKSTIRID